MATRKKAVRKKGSRAAAGSPRREPPVVTLPRKYDDYFQRNFVGPSAKRNLTIACCGSAAGIPTEDDRIGDAFARLTEDLSNSDRAKKFKATKAEIEAIRSWPPSQLRTFRSALIEIFGPAACGARAKPATFQGVGGKKKQSLTVKHGDKIEIKFSGR